MRKAFVLSTHGHKHTLLAPPNTTRSEFVELCNTIAPAAARRLIAKDSSLIGWQNIILEIINVLELHGYSKLMIEKDVEFRSSVPWIYESYPAGTSDTILGEVLQEVIIHKHALCSGENPHQVVS